MDLFLRRSGAALLTLFASIGARAEDALRLVPSHPLAKIPRSEAPASVPDAVLRLSGARGETVSGQAVLVVAGTPETVTATLADLRQEGGAAVPPAVRARLQWVRYVGLKSNTQGVPADELAVTAPADVPDPFWEDPAVAVAPGAAQPLWIEIDIPADAPPGEYRGEIAVAGRAASGRLPVSLRVRDYVLPEERHPHVIQWWDFPGRGFENLTPDQEAWWVHLDRECRFLRRHHQTDVWAAWSLIEQKPPPGGGAPAWDASRFERYAETAFRAGLRAVHFGGAGGHTKSQLEPDSRTTVGEENLGRLAAVQEVVVRRGWEGRVFAAIADEPFIVHEASYGKALERVRAAAPAVRIIEAVETERPGDIDVVVPKLSHLNLWLPQFETLKRGGKEVWFYTCCHPTGRYPNRFLDQPLVKARALHWIGYLHGLDGFLHWGLNWFAAGKDPYSDEGRGIYAGLPPGDAQVAYPGREGLVGSLRLSAMRDGLQDYEALWTLERGLAGIREKLGARGAWLDPRQRPLELCRRVVQSCYDHTRDPRMLLDTRAAVDDEIEGLAAEPRLVVQTAPPEGTVVPLGPAMVNIRGVTTPGAKVTVNGRPLIPENIGPDGCFIAMRFLTREEPEVVVMAEFGGRTRTVRRGFRVVD